MSGCVHARQCLVKKRDEVLRAYELGVRLAVAMARRRRQEPVVREPEAGKRPPAKRPRKGEPSPSPDGFCARCGTCGRLDLVVACLECSYVGCIDHIRKLHARKTDHRLGVDISTSEGLLYCFACGDYVFEDEFEAVRSSILSHLRPEGSGDESNTGLVPDFQATTALRGFYNLGATCFMSVILQMLIHNPMVRNFFLAGGHDSDECTRPNCLACCVDKVFGDFFGSNTVQGFGMTAILTASFDVKQALAGASEQDAHEFLQFLLDELHKSHFQSKIFEQVQHDTLKACTGATHDDDLDHCDCVTHRTFYGQLESRINCRTCGNVTRTVDPMMDLSLEIKNVPKSSKARITLADCLNRFTSVEKLDVPYRCSQCEEQRTVDKQLVIRRLPIVLSIQLKRFEHSKLSAKIETPVKFPLFLDMSKYTTSKSGPPLVYELFGVVCHQGSINTGHYTCMMKSRHGSWFHFDDAMVTKVKASRVLAANAYLLFYMANEVR